MSGVARNLMGPYTPGVPNPRVVHVHPYPTRFHGNVPTRPVFGFPYMRQPHAVYKPDDYYAFYGMGTLGDDETGQGAPEVQHTVFVPPAMCGLGQEEKKPNIWPILIGFGVAFAVTSFKKPKRT